MNPKPQFAAAQPEVAPALDDLLLDIATMIELTENDRRVAENRYRRLKPHLERPSSPLRPYLMTGTSLIYPQGSIATGTAIVSGTDDERYDLDAMVEFEVPPEWTPSGALDRLADALDGFPDVSEIERCTRCIQLRFPFMHLDVTLLDPIEPRPPRAGEIFHAPDRGPSRRVHSNPFGFADWFRGRMYANEKFAERLRERRRHVQVNRFAVRAAEQDALPDMIPPQLDTQRVVALKLLKRVVKLRYEGRDLRLPPSVHMSLFAGRAEELDGGLCAQLEQLAAALELDLRLHIAAGTKPDHRNPCWELDKINDRWPANAEDMTVFADDLRLLREGLRRARSATFAEINKIFAALFGERVTKRTFDAYLQRAATGSSATRSQVFGPSATVIASSAVVAPAVARAAQPVRAHNFHSETMKKREP